MTTPADAMREALVRVRREIMPNLEAESLHDQVKLNDWYSMIDAALSLPQQSGIYAPDCVNPECPHYQSNTAMNRVSRPARTVTDRTKPCPTCGFHITYRKRTPDKYDDDEFALAADKGEG